MEFTLDMSDHIVMQSKHTMFRILNKILATGRPFDKTLSNIIAIIGGKWWRWEATN